VAAVEPWQTLFVHGRMPKGDDVPWISMGNSQCHAEWPEGNCSSLHRFPIVLPHDGCCNFASKNLYPFFAANNTLAFHLSNMEPTPKYPKVIIGKTTWLPISKDSEVTGRLEIGNL